MSYHKNKPTKKEVFNTLELMCIKNPKLEKLIKTFDCWIDNPKSNELMDSNEILKTINENKLINKEKLTTNKKYKYYVKRNK